MKQERHSSFDSFMWGGQHPSNDSPKETEQNKGPETENNADWISLAKECQKTWKAVSPLVQPLVNKFKK
ncbi:hypothetical protein [Halobacillus seohaensis]|uniref:Uncharacterized protein n=1 Tax=Halobacillus seohaensis TaxID=447421 RepID=A0ABW2EKU3_9BACI